MASQLTSQLSLPFFQGGDKNSYSAFLFKFRENLIFPYVHMVFSLTSDIFHSCLCEVRVFISQAEYALLQSYNYSNTIVWIVTFHLSPLLVVVQVL